MDKDAAEKSIREKKSFLDSLEKEVKSRMEKAQTDVSAFLVDMMMKHGLSSSNAAGDEKAERKEESPLFQSGQAWDGDSFNYDNLGYVRDNLIENLESAGVNLDDAKALAPCFYSAYINHVPLILAGPNGKNIADAVSITMGNRKAGNMDCRGDYNPEAIEQCKSSEDKVITVTNPFNSRWAPYLPELLDSDRLTLLLVPYSEELTLEMKSLYNFALPLVTDFVIHKKAAEEEFIGGQIYSELIEDHKDYHMDTRWTSMLRKYHVEGMTEYWVKLLLKDWIPYVKNKEDIWYRFFMNPYAYATGNLEKMSQYVNDRDNDLSDETKKLFKEDGESE